MRKIKIKPELLSLLTSGAFNHFTSQALISAYSELPTSLVLNKKQIQQFIFRNLERLTWAGLATKMSEGKTMHAEYSLTEKFTPSHYSIGTPHTKKSAKETKQLQVDPLQELKEQLKAHKLELLTTIAEIEEYEELCQQLPSKQLEIQQLYNDARNRYSKTLGKVKAIESLISYSERSD